MLKKFLISLGLVAMLAVASCSSDDDGGTSGQSGSADEFCSLLLAFAASNNSLGDDVTSGDAGAASTALKRIVGQVQLLQEKAPADIKADVDVAAAFIVEFDGLMAKYGYDLSRIENDPAASDEFASMNDDEVGAALEQLQLYGDSECASTATTG